MPTDDQNTKDTLELMLGKKLLAFEETPPPGAWKGIQQGLGGVSGANAAAPLWKNVYFITSLTALLVSMACYIFFNQKEVVSNKSNDLENLELKNNDAPVSIPEFVNAGKDILPEAAIENTNSKPEDTQTKKGNVTSTSAAAPVTVASPNNMEVIPQPSTSSDAKQKHVVSHPLDAAKDSVVAAHAPDTVKKTTKPKSFYDKQRKDTSLKYQQLFKEK